MKTQPKMLKILNPSDDFYIDLIHVYVLLFINMPFSKHRF